LRISGYAKRIEALDRRDGRALDGEDESPRDIDKVQQPDVRDWLVGHFAPGLRRSFAQQS
jgi:hypothetical protein